MPAPAMQTPRRRTYEVEIMGMMSQPNLASNAVQEFVSLQSRKGASHCRKLLADGAKLDWTVLTMCFL